VMRARGQEASEGDVLRYLAELAWVPQAMLANRQLEWRELDEHTVEVTTRVGSARATVRLEFDAAGDIVGTWCDARPYLEGGFPMEDIAPPYDSTWAFVLRAEPDKTTRLLVRERYAYKRPRAPLIVEPTEALSFVMSQKMLRAIKDRAERTAAFMRAA
jgi:hypothetical protein